MKKGYMIVKCRGQKEITENVSLTEAIEREKAFFKDHAYFQILYDEGHATVPKLAEKLTLELVHHIQKSLPRLEEQIEKKLIQTQTELDKYGNGPPSDPAERLSFLIDRVTAFTQDAISLTTGEELRFGVKKLLKKELFKVAGRSLVGFPNLIRTAKVKIEEIRKEKEAVAESMLRTQFKMESIVYTQDSRYSKKLGKRKREDELVLAGFAVGPVQKSTNNTVSNCGATLKEMIKHLKSYYQIAGQRLADQVPLVIRYQMLHESAIQLQREMLQMLQDKEKLNSLLQEDSGIKTKRIQLQGRLNRLTKARILLTNFRIITMSTLNQQYEEKVRPCIDLIDSLRSLGVEKDLALPAIAVIGDQSSGKSSVLEALSGVSLPRGSGIVTRCPLELKMKRKKEGEEWYGKISYQEYEEEIEDPADPQDEMAGIGVGISDDLISLVIASPDVPDLTLIDLPGIARVAVKDNQRTLETRIKRLIQKFIKKQETISLVVVPCNVDIATTEALKMAQEVDPDGERTLGILTKPDLVDKGTEETVVDIVHNDVIHLKKGYMIVKCRGQKEITEKRSLPRLEEQIEEKLEQTRAELERYGNGPPSDPAERDFFLIDKVTAFVQDAISLTTGEELKCGERLNVFSILRKEFGKWNAHLDRSGEKFNDRIEREVEEYEEKYRGRELPGFINYKTFELMVKEQIKQLEEPAVKKLKDLGDAVRKVFLQLAQSSFTGFPVLMKTAKIASQRLADQIPMVIRYQMLQQSAIQLQREMMQVLQDKEKSEVLLKEDFDIGSKRAALQCRLERLMKARIVTRCPLELKMKRKKEGEEWYGKISYQDNEEEIEDPADVEKKIQEAQKEIAGVGVGISEDLISLVIASPDVPDLTLIDLPGIARVAVRGQPENIGDQIKRLIQKFIKKQETIILVVVPCNVDIATTEALKMAQEVDPDGERTWGILTKPDLVDKGTEETRSLPRMEEQIDKKLEQIRAELERYGNRPPSDPAERDVFLLATVNTFNQGAMSLAAGEQLKCGERPNVFSILRKEFEKWDAKLHGLGEKFNEWEWNGIEREVEEYEEKYRGRELPGFINYKTFEMMVREQIKQLEEPAVKTLKHLGDAVMRLFIQLARSSFTGFPNLIKTAKAKIESVKQENESTAESMLRTQFKMELLVYSQDRIYLSSLSGRKREEEEESGEEGPFNQERSIVYSTDNHATLKELMLHLKSYYKMLQQSAIQLQREMIQVLQDKEQSEFLLKEDFDICSKRAALQYRLERLMKARTYLAEF
ncbi:Interferon-induced GTP-binding protein Mx [Nibea albiflora]|nr:Interferon-induced GTP-binding protein Mx [Nibea albiflora]